MIDKIVLHGTPGDEPGFMRMCPVQPYDGEPRLHHTYKMKELNGGIVRDLEVYFYYTHTDREGLPHYHTRVPKERAA